MSSVRRDRLWFKVDTKFWDAHADTVGEHACVVYLRILGYCKERDTDGLIPARQVRAWTDDDGHVVEALIARGLITRDGDRLSVTDWHKWYEPVADREERLRKDRDRKRRPLPHTPTPNEEEAEIETETGKVAGKLHGKVSGIPAESEVASDSTRTSTRNLMPEFGVFWDRYPRKVGKRDAHKAFIAAVKRADAEAILAGLARQSWPADQKFIPYPATWLNRDGWDDQPTMQGATGSLFDLAEQARRLEEGQRFFG